MTYLKEELHALIQKDIRIFDFIQESGLDGIIFRDLINEDHEWQDMKFWNSLGYSKKEVLKLKNSNELYRSSRLLRIDSKAEYSENLTTISFDLEEFDEFKEYHHKSGKVLTFKAAQYLVYNEKNEPVRQLLGLKNITSNNDLAKKIKHYEQIIEGTGIGAWEWNLQTHEVIFNEQWAKILGYSLEELQPITPDIWNRFCHPDDTERCAKLLDDHISGKNDVYESEARMRHKNGSWIWVLDKGKVVSYTPDGKAEWMTGFHEEITQRKKEFERNRLFIDKAPSEIAMFDNNMRYLAASQRWTTGYGIDDIEIIGRCHYDIFPKISDEWKAIHKECLGGKTLKKDEDSYIGLDGELHWLSWEISPWYNHNNEIGGILMHTSDITPIKAAEQAIKEKQALLEAVLNNIEVGIVCCDTQGKLTLFNKATQEWHGLPVEPIDPSEFPEYYHLFEADGETPLATENIPLIKSLRTGSVKNQEIVIQKVDGTYKIVSVNGSHLKDIDGNVLGAVVAMHDITTKKIAEDRLRISEQTFRGNFENAAIGMAIVDITGQWVEVNKSLCSIFGYTEEELLKSTLEDLTHPDDLEIDLQHLEELIRGIRNFYHIEKRYIHKNGETIHGILSVSIVLDESGAPLHFVSQITDITLRKKTQQKLQNTLAYLESIFQASSRVSIIATDTNGIITSFNKGAENLLGYSREEMENKCSPQKIHLKKEIKKRGRELEKLLGIDVKEIKPLTALADKGQFDTREWTYVRKNGTQFPVLLTVTPIKDEEEIIGYLGIGTEITQLKNAEKEIISLLEVTKDQNERLKNFAHIVSHNLRSHSGNFEMLLDLYVQENPEAKENEMIQYLNVASENLKETIAHLNEVVLINTSMKDNLVKIDLKECIDKSSKNIGAIARDIDVKIINNVDASIKVLGIPAYMDSILLNFLTNGVKYSSRERDSYIKLSTNIEDEFVVLSIEDNGIGIDLKKNESKLFGMYKTFHKNKDARGIGLFITKNQVEALGGKIETESTVDIGTTFKIYFKYEKN